MTTPLRVLLVEDEVLVVMMLEDILERAGHIVAGPASTIAEARAVVAGERVDVALLDVNLRGRPVYPLAGELDRAGIPFAFLSGYGAEGLDPAWGDRPCLGKPFREPDVLRLLEQARAGRP